MSMSIGDGTLVFLGMLLAGIGLLHGFLPVVTAEWLLHGPGERATRAPRDKAWEEAVKALRVVWRDPGRRATVMSVLRAMRPG